MLSMVRNRRGASSSCSMSKSSSAIPDVDAKVFFGVEVGVVVFEVGVDVVEAGVDGPAVSS